MKFGSENSCGNRFLIGIPHDLANVPLGTIHLLRKQTGWVGGIGQLLTYAYEVGGWVKDHAYVKQIIRKP